MVKEYGREQLMIWKQTAVLTLHLHEDAEKKQKNSLSG
jgi:hypothetical protein